ncbi:metabolite traffic protein EboE [Algoriphagus vanfongensis]|uniref:metabolite traffic protein EboE n=1 Tax=Algoriphagus vanfongensis TaxID=426371 RepID=UPI00041C139E|nr:metabolite traffic protein EboE [Algoriphagus vanfongensis]
MQFSNFHLSYCSNIHPGESWEATFENLKHYIPEVRKNLDFKGPFGIGLRLSHEASLILQKPEELARFQTWLQEENAYVFTLNGFPYGDFHRTVVKDQVHFPDWTTPERKDYTIRSFKILAQLLPEGQDGGISTSPISYRHWFKTQEAFGQGMEVATSHLMEVVTELAKIEAETGKLLHLDIEPEPDGILENSDEMVWLFTDWLLPKGAPELAKALGISVEESETLIKRHIQVCYDVCHFAIVYEKPEETFEKFAKAGIKIGKVQISAALKLMLDQDRGVLKNQLSEFAESTYLHQVVGRNTDGSLISYPDLLPALEKLEDAKEEEWRIHFHVPVFMKKYGEFESTNFLIEEVLKVLQSQPELSNHLEVETYTWEVLPPESRLPLAESISRELAWVMSQLN